MLIQELTTSECLRILARERLGRLGCTRENQPYVVPIYFVYEDPYLYSFTTPGLKVDWMRLNPLVCVEVDEVRAEDQWTCIIVFGRYEELEDPEERRAHEPGQPMPRQTWEAQPELLHALELLQTRASWWQTGSASGIHRDPRTPLTPVFYRIRIDRITGRRATPSSRPSSARETQD